VDQENLQDLIRANTFNLGVIESKIGGDLSLAEILLKKAIEDARLLSDLQSERNAWWELANLNKLQNNFETALECHLNELRLAQLDDLQETELLCLYDIGINVSAVQLWRFSCTDRASLDSCHTFGDE
jgi:tetratricopeptide (TPR) repeat protein